MKDKVKQTAEDVFISLLDELPDNGSPVENGLAVDRLAEKAAAIATRFHERLARLLPDGRADEKPKAASPPKPKAKS